MGMCLPDHWLAIECGSRPQPVAPERGAPVRDLLFSMAVMCGRDGFSGFDGLPSLWSVIRGYICEVATLLVLLPGQSRVDVMRLTAAAYGVVRAEL